MRVDRITYSRDICEDGVRLPLGFGSTGSRFIRSADPKTLLRKPNTDRITRCGDIADFSLHMRISAIFLLRAEVLVTNSESHTAFPIHL